MITLQDLEAAIAECQGERNPNANTCIKLAAFYTIRDQMYGGEAIDTAPLRLGYSTQAAPVPAAPLALEQAEKLVDYDSGSEFSSAIDGKEAAAVWDVMDELMEVLNATNPRLFSGVLRKLQEI